MNNNSIDTKIWNNIKQMLGDKLPTLVQYFIEDGETYITTIKTAIANNEIEPIIRPAHTLKSSGKQIGAIELGNIAEELEQLSRKLIEEENNSLDSIIPLAKSLYKHFEDVKITLTQLKE